ncbi:MAG: hypothetical protein WAN60_02545 [Candidatus Sulfotelmatobacter sp.]
MPRAALFTLLVASVLSGAVQAQRTGVGGHSNAAGPHIRSGFVGPRGSRVSSRPGLLPSRLHRPNNFGSYFLPYGDPLENDGYAQPDAEAATDTAAPPLMIPRTRESLPKSQFIEIPGVANAAAPKIPPPAVFILASGERLEARRFLLSASLLSVSIDRQQRSVPLAMLDIHATLSANHDRGIDLRIPDDRNEICLSF